MERCSKCYNTIRFNQGNKSEKYMHDKLIIFHFDNGFIMFYFYYVLFYCDTSAAFGTYKRVCPRNSRRSRSSTDAAGGGPGVRLDWPPQSCWTASEMQELFTVKYSFKLGKCNSSYDIMLKVGKSFIKVFFLEPGQ